MKNEKRFDEAFLSRGFQSFDKGPNRFSHHELSACHREAAVNLVNISTVSSIKTTISTQAAEAQKVAQEALSVIVTSLRFLALQNIAVQGARSDSGNFFELMKLRCIDNQSLSMWISKRDNWTSNTIQNEILGMLAHDVQRQIVVDVTKSPYIGLVADGTTDTDGKEQFSIVVRYLSTDDFGVHDAFLGMYNPTNSTADALTAAIRDVLVRLQIPMDKLRGHSFDGASNMSGRLHGVQAQLNASQPKSMFVHCVNHSLDLALQEIASEVALVRDSLTLVRDIANVFRESAKRKEKLRVIADDIAVLDGTNDSPAVLLALCPTRWCVRTRAITRLLKSWKVVMLALDELLLETGRGDAKSKMVGLRKQMSKMKTYLGVTVCQALFGPCEDLAKGLQSEKTTATGAIQGSNVLLTHLKKLRDADEFSHLYDQATIDATHLGLMIPDGAKEDQTTRSVRGPARYEMQQVTGAPHAFTVKEKLRCEYYSSLDLLTSEIQRRFDQPGLRHMATLERILTDSSITEEELSGAVTVYDDIDKHKLWREINMLQDLLQSQGEC